MTVPAVASSDQLVVGRAVARWHLQLVLPQRHARPRERAASTTTSACVSRRKPRRGWTASDARPIPAVSAAPAVVGSIRLTPTPDRIRIRIPVSHRVPFQLSETDRTVSLRLYGALGDVNWIQYGAAEDPLLERVSWSQDRREEVLLTIELSRTVWGYAAVWERGDLVLDIRRPPALDPGGSLKGRFIAVDPGHPPGGSTGPTGLREAEANLAIGLEVKRLLEEQGARVFMTRTEDVPVELWPRVDAAQRAGADLLVSIHNNALPDGVNPLTNSGSSVYYNHPRSVPLARAIQAELVRRLGVPRPRHRPRGPRPGPHHLDALGADRGIVRHRARAGGRPALARRPATLRAGRGGRHPPVLARAGRGTIGFPVWATGGSGRLLDRNPEPAVVPQDES